MMLSFLDRCLLQSSKSSSRWWMMMSPLFRILLILAIILIFTTFLVFSQFGINNYDSIRIKSTTFPKSNKNNATAIMATKMTTKSNNANYVKINTTTTTANMIPSPSKHIKINTSSTSSRQSPPSDWLRPERWEYLVKAAAGATPDGGGEPLHLIFIHIPKTGGESIEDFLHIPKQHYLASQRSEEMLHHPRHVSFTIIRNPYDRMVSWYEHCRKVQFAPDSIYFQNDTIPNPQEACKKALEKEFEDWLEWIVKNPKSGILKSGNSAFLPCATWIHQTSATATTGIVDGQEDISNVLLVDFIIRFEKLQDDLERLLDILTMLGYYTWPNAKPQNSLLPRFNGSVRNTTTIDYYSSERSRRWIETEHELDLKLFGYKLE